jgi:inorganic pyrophosphatase
LVAHPWHDVDPGFDGAFAFRAVIEIPAGERNKYELDKETGLLKLDRVLFSAVVYPGSYGFVPKSLADDGDPLDVLVLALAPIAPLTIVACRALGTLRLLDEGEPDDKIVAVPERDPEFEDYRGVRDLPPHRMREIARFFADYKALESKKVVVQGVRGPSSARRLIAASLRSYARELAPKQGRPGRGA